MIFAPQQFQMLRNVLAMQSRSRIISVSPLWVSTDDTKTELRNQQNVRTRWLTKHTNRRPFVGEHFSEALSLWDMLYWEDLFNRRTNFWIKAIIIIIYHYDKSRNWKRSWIVNRMKSAFSIVDLTFPLAAVMMWHSLYSYESADNWTKWIKP